MSNVEVYEQNNLWELHRGDAIDVLEQFPDNTVDAVVTDPPYGLSQHPDMAEVLTKWLAGEDYQHRGAGFQGNSWDSFVPGPSVWKQVFRVMKPGAHAAVFAGSRTLGLMDVSLRLAGFEVRDTLMWVTGTGFPKSHNVSKAIDKKHGAQRERIKTGQKSGGMAAYNRRNEQQGYRDNAYYDEGNERISDEPVTEDAARWAGWGTALKPAYEPVLIVRKPLQSTIVDSVLKHGTGALNIDASRVPTPATPDDEKPAGRWPANLMLSHTLECEPSGTTSVKGSVNHHTSKTSIGGDGIYQGGAERVGHDYVDKNGNETVETWNCHPSCPVRQMNEQSGDRTSPWKGNRKGNTKGVKGGNMWGSDVPNPDSLKKVEHGDAGGAARFFYCAKPSQKEREAGITVTNGKKGNIHPTVKPLEVMRWLVTLITPPDGIVLDPFVGSGTTGCAATSENFRFIGIDKDEDGTYLNVAKQRIRHHADLHQQDSLF